MSSPILRAFRITMPNSNGSALTTEIEDVIEDINLLRSEGGVGSKIIIEIVDISEEDLENLPEFTGW